jgi:hypothetical protein
MPTCDPDTIRALELYLPITTLSSLNTSRIGRPEMSLTLINEPLNKSEMPNSDPELPMKEMEPSGKTSMRMLDEALPLNTIVGLSPLLLLGVIIMSAI